MKMSTHFNKFPLLWRKVRIMYHPHAAMLRRALCMLEQVEQTLAEADIIAHQAGDHPETCSFFYHFDEYGDHHLDWNLSPNKLSDIVFSRPVGIRWVSILRVSLVINNNRKKATASLDVTYNAATQEWHTRLRTTDFPKDMEELPHILKAGLALAEKLKLTSEERLVTEPHALSVVRALGEYTAKNYRIEEVG